MTTDTKQIEEFRDKLYLMFPKRKDAIMNLLDALSCHGRKYGSVVQLSNSQYFERQYSSITDAISDGLPDACWDEIKKLIFQYNYDNASDKPYKFIVDCTANPRPYSKKLDDRHITHYPNPAPGNKPICVGHQYSVLTLLPNDEQSASKNWLVPVSAKRVNSSNKGNEAGMTQIVDTMQELGLTDKLSISIGDSLYGSQQCRMTASQQNHLVHIFRLNSKRNVFFKPQEDSKSKGRKKEYGSKMKLSDASTHQECHESIQTEWITKKGKQHSVNIKLWENVLLRGSREFRSSQHPLNIVQITVTNDKGEPVFKKPMWIAVIGDRRHEISTIDIYNNYKSRYNIEHFFRFGKRNLMMDSYQTPDIGHEALWWQFCMVAYTQLYMARNLVKSTPQPWERYSKAYKESDKQGFTSPSQTQRGFSALLNQIGTPANNCRPRGKAPGRMAGSIQEARVSQDIIFKTKKSTSKPKEIILSGLELDGNISNPERIDALIKTVQDSLTKMNVSKEKFSEILINSS